MQVLLKKSETRQDVQCSVCGQGFKLYWERTLPAERATMRLIVLGELRVHHASEYGNDKSRSAHPASPFNLPNWGSPLQFSAPALPSSDSNIRRTANK